MTNWLILMFIVTWLAIIFVGIIAYVAVRLARKIWRVDVAKDIESEGWKLNLFFEFLNLLPKDAARYVRDGWQKERKGEWKS